ncbi:hypothetical protein ACWIF8_01435 [Micromonospora chalcea]
MAGRPALGRDQAQPQAWFESGSVGGYRAALDAGADPAVVTAWIAQTQAERARAETELRTIARTTPRRMSQGEITALVTALGDITTVLRNANPADKAEVGSAAPAGDRCSHAA